MYFRLIKRFSLFLMSLMLFTLISTSQAAVGELARVSVATGGVEGNDFSDRPAISGNGRYIAFYSAATNLVVADENMVGDVFLHDTQTSITTRVSVDSNGVAGNGESINPTISADGRYIAFSSEATNLVEADENGMRDIFFHDTQTGVTRLVSVAAGDIQGNGNSNNPAFSADGQFVAFSSYATTFDTLDKNETGDIFVHNIQAGEISRVSVATDGTEGDGASGVPVISADGQYISFYSAATNLVTGDNNAQLDIFLHNRQAGTTTRISVATGGTEGNDYSENHAISADGRYILFDSQASNLVNGDNNGVLDVFLHDTQTETTTRISLFTNSLEGNLASLYPAISPDGKYVIFTSYASNWISGDEATSADLFLYNMEMDTLSHIVKQDEGAEFVKRPSASFSTDGQYIAFPSVASTLVSGDNNGTIDIFVYENELTTTMEVYLPFVVQNTP